MSFSLRGEVTTSLFNFYLIRRLLRLHLMPTFPLGGMGYSTRWIRCHDRHNRFRSVRNIPYRHEVSTLYRGFYLSDVEIRHMFSGAVLTHGSGEQARRPLACSAWCRRNTTALVPPPALETSTRFARGNGRQGRRRRISPLPARPTHQPSLIYWSSAPHRPCSAARSNRPGRPAMASPSRS